MRLAALTILLAVSSLSFGQRIEDFNHRRDKISSNGMITLGSWAVANIGSGAAGWAASNNPEWQSFHQMNLIWGTVNLGLAIPSYLGARKYRRHDKKGKLSDEMKDNYADPSWSYRSQIKKEKIFLANTAFDLFYIAAGAVMRERAKWDVANTDRLNGWGNSFIMQGSFLFAFDLAMTLIHNRHRKNKFEPLITVSSTPYGLGMRMTL